MSDVTSANPGPAATPSGETTPSRPDVSVVIVSWKVRDLLDRCLTTLRETTRETRLEVLVVDNQSGDGTLEMVREKHPQVAAIDAGGNLGFSGGNNLGFARAAGRFVLLLNPDTEVRTGAVDRLRAALEADPGLGIVGPKVLLPGGDVQLACARHFPNVWSQTLQILGLTHRFPRNYFAGHFRMGYWDHLDERDVDAVSGCCLLIRGELLEELQGLDESFFMYGEDLDLCWRTRRAGYRVHYLPQAEILHHSKQSSRQAEIRMLVHTHQSMYRFFRKNRGPVVAFLYRAALGSVSAGWVLLESLRSLVVGGEKARILRTEAIPYYRTIVAWATGRWRLKAGGG